ncbi:MAG: AMP-binding protein, partial [Gemmatimonadaceae bacterium]|nr:AMP-binding protein [Gemmatimonadaceae bacterium]
MQPALAADFAPWSRAFNGDAAPFWRWFEGALTNAGFNEVDRHVLAGHGAEPALIFEGDRWDMSVDGGRGGPVDCYPVSRRQLLLESAKCSIALQALGLRRGDRIALNMPNIPAQLYWTEGAKRLGVVYTPVFGGFSDKTLSDRIHDAGARVVITLRRWLPRRPDRAVQDGVHRSGAGRLRPAALRAHGGGGHAPVARRDAGADRDAAGCDRRSTLAGGVTVQRSDVMRGVGRAL